MLPKLNSTQDMFLWSVTLAWVNSLWYSECDRTWLKSRRC